MSPRRMRDLVIIIPGILGSELRKHGQPIWSVAHTCKSVLWQRERLLTDLTLHSDDPDLDDLDDGVVASGLINDVLLIPGFYKIDGYTGLWRSLRDALELKPGDIFAPDPTANLYVFPYDWRRDNRVAARRLAAFVTHQLHSWRDTDGEPDSKVILIGHSMGGLVARYYLECLGGWEYCRALMTLGTPYRGSFKALDYLVNGHKLLHILDVGPVLKTFTSTYQLLPTYAGIAADQEYVRIPQATVLPADLRARANAAANDFHGAISSAARARAADGTRTHQQIFPYVGTYQPTLQGGWLNADEAIFVPSPLLPEPLQAAGVPADGDDTVPAFSALPPEYASITDGPVVTVAGRHSSLQNNTTIIDDLIVKIHGLQSRGGWDRLAPEHEVRWRRPALRLTLADSYPSEGGLIEVQAVDSADPGDLIARVTPLDPSVEPFELPFRPHGDGWAAELVHPQPGLYRVTVEPYRQRSDVAPPITDVFEVAPSE